MLDQPLFAIQTYFKFKLHVSPTSTFIQVVTRTSLRPPKPYSLVSGCTKSLTESERRKDRVNLPSTATTWIFQVKKREVLTPLPPSLSQGRYRFLSDHRTRLSVAAGRIGQVILYISFIFPTNIIDFPCPSPLAFTF